MKALILLLFCLCSRADWRDTQYFYWFNGVTPAVALTVSNIVSADHCTGSVGAVQIGDQHGVLSGLCTGFISDGVCGGSIQDCQWGRQYKNLTNDSYFFYTCRPVSLGITPIQTNISVGSQVLILSVVDNLWHSANLTFKSGGTIYTFADGETAYYELMVCQGWNPASGSCSPVFTPWGDFVGNITGSSAVTNAVIHAFYPSGSVYSIPRSPGVSGLSGLFNSDPDR